VLRAGGATVVSCEPSQVTPAVLKVVLSPRAFSSLQGIRYGFIDRDILKEHPDIRPLFARLAIPLLQPEFLSDVLVKYCDVPEDLSPYLVADKSQ